MEEPGKIMNAGIHITRIVLAAGFAAAIALSFASCDLFEPRSPEDPIGTRGNFVPPTAAEIVIENLINAVNDRNAQHYIQCFADPAAGGTDTEFEFHATLEAQQQFGTVFDEWSIVDERRYFENLLSSIPASAFIILSLENERFESQTSNTARYFADYRLTAQHTDEGLQEQSFEGTLQFDMITDLANNWVIHEWHDFGGGDTRSWSELKGVFIF
jgi:hypothetical protein